MLKKKYYEHFLLLHFAIYCLSSHQFITNFEHSSYCQLQFEEKSKKLYGNHFQVYNVHVLLHLTDFCRRYGLLQSWSCFPFETFLSVIVSRIRSPSLPVKQLRNRLAEMNAFSEALMISPQVCYKPNQVDCFVRLKSSLYVKILNAVDGKFAGNILHFHENVYSYPFESSLLGICKVRTTQNDINFLLEDVQCKCIGVPVRERPFEDFYIIPYTSMSYVS